jgi:hypothetical protein
MAYARKSSRSALSEYESSGAMPLETPEHVHQDESNPGDDRGPSPWLLTKSEQDRRDFLLEKIRSGNPLTEQERQELGRLCQKQGLGDSASSATLITDSGHIPFTPR